MAEVLKEEEPKESEFIPYEEDDFIPYEADSELDKQITLDPETDYKVEYSPKQVVMADLFKTNKPDPQ